MGIAQTSFRNGGYLRMSFYTNGGRKCDIMNDVKETSDMRTTTRRCMNMFDTSRIHPMLDKVQAYLGPWLEDHLKQIYPADWWDKGVMSVLVPEQCERVLDDGAKTPADLDLAMQITVFRGNWTLLRRRFHLNPQLYDDAATVKRVRNKYSHKKSGKDYEKRFEHDMETVRLFLEGLGISSENIRVTANNVSVLDTATGKGDGADETSKTSIVPDSVGVSKIATSRPSMANPTSEVQGGIIQNAPNEEDWTDVASLLKENILACLKDEYSWVNVGECLLLRKNDTLPEGVTAIDEWQQVVMLHVRDADREKIAKEITEFIYMGGAVPTDPYVNDEWVVWQFPRPCRHETNVRLSTNVFLPQWLSQYLYKERGLTYQTDCEAVQYNLNADRDFSFQYLATYFPRTFAEISSIFDYIFATRPSVKKAMGDRISILDVGCGSGAAAMALMWSLKKARMEHVRKITVFGLDGNENFLERFNEMIPLIKANWAPVEIEIVAKGVKDIEAALRTLPDDSRFDFVVSSKFIQELKRADAYQVISTLCLKHLKRPGIVCLLENYRMGRTEENGLCASRSRNCQVAATDKIDFSVLQIPGCSCVTETVGFQMFFNQL